MDRPDYPPDERPGPASKVPGLIHDYRAQRDAWREQARNLARMREEVLAAADTEARDIVSSARAEVRRILLKARRDLLVLAAQVRAAGRLGDGEDSPETLKYLPPDAFGQANDALSTARHDVRRLLEESRPELEGLASEGETLRAALRQQPAPSRVDTRRHITIPPVQDIPAEGYVEAPVDFEFTTIGADESPALTVRDGRRPLRTILAAAATLGGLAVMGTGVWLWGPWAAETNVESAATENTTPSAKTTATSAVPPARTAGNLTGERRSPIPTSNQSKSPLSIQLSTRRSSWIRITQDGRVTAERIFRAGESQLVRASRDVSIRAGDAGAVTVAVGGGQAVALGREGEVVTRRFTAAAPAVQRPTPAPSAPNPSVPVAQAAPPRPAPVSVAQSTPPQLTTTTTAPRVIEQQPVAPPPVVSTPPPPSTSLAAAPPAASAERPAAPLAPPTSATRASLQDTLTNSALRWLDAHYRQDRATMTAISAQVSVADDRSEKERLPRGLTGVRRSLEDVNFQLAGGTAIMTARMTERMDNPAAGQMAQAVSFISHMWTQSNGSWQLHDVRIVSASALARAVR